MDKRSKIENLINFKKEKGSRRKSKYATRKLSIGLVSCMLGFILIVSPTETRAAGEVSSTLAETEAVADKSIETTDTNEVNASETDKNLEEKSDQESNEAQESNKVVEDNTGDLDSENSEDVASKESDSFTPSITEITVEEGDLVDDYQKAITNIPAGARLSISSPADTSVVGVNHASGSIIYADGSSMDVSIPVNVTEKTIENDANDTKAGEDLDVSPEDSKSNPKNINLFAVEPDFNGTTVETVIVKKGIGESDFNFAGIFGDTPDTKVTLTNKKDGTVQEATFNAEDGTITFKNPVSMDDVKNGDVSIKFSGTSIAGKFIQNESNASYDGTSNITTFTLTLSQYRNNDVVVTTVDRDNEASNNPETTPTSGKIKMTDGRERSREVNIPTDNTETSVARRPNSRNIDDFNKSLSVEVTNQENGFLVDKDGNKVYKPAEITPDRDGLKPTEIKFTEKPLVTTTGDAGDDKDYAKVTFVVGNKGKTPSETSKTVIKGVSHGEKITAPENPEGKKGYTFKEWSNGGVQDVYNADTRHEALFNVVSPTGQNITTGLNSTPDAASAISNSAELPDGTSFAWQAVPDVTSTGEKSATVTVTYPDGTTQDVPVTVTVKNTIPAKPIEDIAKTTKVTKETIPAEVKYEADDSLNFEEKKEDKAPVDGEKEVTTVSEPGKDDVVTEKVTKDPVDGLTKVGNKKVETVKNEDGSTTETTTIYDVNPETGELSNPTTKTKTTMPAGTIEDIAKTTKVTTEKVPGKVKYVADENVEYGQQKVDKAPEDGEKEVTTVSQPGEKDVVTEKVTKDPVDGLTKVGNKKVETKTNDDGSTTTTTTIYDVDPDTGKLSNPKTTTKTEKPDDGKTDAEKNSAVAPEKTVVEDKTALTDEEKAKVEEEVKKTNPEATDVTVGDDGSVTITYPDGSENTLTPDQTITEKTPAEEYLAVFNGNGGTPTTQKVTVKDGEVVSGVVEPTREGYKFVKWVKLGTDNALDLSTPFNKDLLDEDNAVIFTAVWEKNVSENGGSAIFYPKETHPIFKKVGDELTEEEITNAIVVLGLDKSKYTVTINEGQEVPTTDKPGDYIIDVTINFEDGSTDDAQVIIIVTGEEDTTGPSIDAGNVIAVEGQPIPPVLVDVDDLDATVSVDGLPEGLTYNPETKQIEGTIAKADDWGDDEEVRTQSATITATDEDGNTTTKDITITILRDTDGDGTPDAIDIDDDNDGVDDQTEKSEGTDPKDSESKPEIVDEDDEDPSDDCEDPSDDGSKPSDDDNKPSDDDSKPSDDGSKPSDDDNKQSDDDSKPSDDDTKPSDEDSKPSDDENKTPADENTKPEPSDKGDEGTNDAAQGSRGQAGSINPAKRPREVSSDTSKNAGKNVKTGIAGEANTVATLAMAAAAFLASKKKKEEDDN